MLLPRHSRDPMHHRGSRWSSHATHEPWWQQGWQSVAGAGAQHHSHECTATRSQSNPLPSATGYPDPVRQPPRHQLIRVTAHASEKPWMLTYHTQHPDIPEQHGQGLVQWRNQFAWPGSPPQSSGINSSQQTMVRITNTSMVMPMPCTQQSNPEQHERMTAWGLIKITCLQDAAAAPRKMGRQLQQPAWHWGGG